MTNLSRTKVCGTQPTFILTLITVANNHSARSQHSCFTPWLAELAPKAKCFIFLSSAIFQPRQRSWPRTRRTTSKIPEDNVLTQRSFFHIFLYVSISLALTSKAFATYIRQQLAQLQAIVRDLIEQRSTSFKFKDFLPKRKAFE